MYAHWTPAGQGDDDPAPAGDIKAILDKYADVSKLNFADTVAITDSEGSYDDYYEYYGGRVLNVYEDIYGDEWRDYYDLSDDEVWYFYGADESGNYSKYDDATQEFWDSYAYTVIVEFTELNKYSFTAQGDCYVASNPSEAGKAVLGDYGDDYPWKSLTLYVANGNITKIVGVLSDNTKYEHVFSKFGSVNFTLPDATEPEPEPQYTITVDTSKPTVIEVGAEVNYAQYFTITDESGNNIPVTDAMLDLTNADTSKEGTFTVTLTYEGVSKQLAFVVVEQGADTTVNPAELTEIFAKYADSSKWNFAVSIAGETEDYYEYLGNLLLNKYLGTDGSSYIDYWDFSGETFYLYADNGKGTYSKLDDSSEDFLYSYTYLSVIDLSAFGDYKFVKSGDDYVALDPNGAGGAVLGAYADYSWISFVISVENGNISKLVGVMDDGETVTYALSKYGAISFTLPTVGGGDNPNPKPNPSDTMENQNYNPETFDDERLQDKLTTTGNYYDPSIGLPSEGTYTALVIPVKFSNTTISDQQLTNLNIAFNGTSEQTGWESVKTYYQKASYGKLNLSFDIAGVNLDGVSYYTSSKTSSYYEQQTDKDGYSNGDNVLLNEVLAYYESRLDLTKYDTNNDGAIDAVYLIYSAPVDYSDDSFYWAFVTWDNDDGATKYDGKDVYYYLFAGLGFMDENVQGKTPDTKNMPVINGLKVNASTYIHETGHLLGLDDYYDYYLNGEYFNGEPVTNSSDEGLGGADMMDYTMGDHGVYSKIMLNWLTPEIITSTKTVTIQSSQSGAYALLIPLDYDNSYFCEYLLIDLYSAEGLNRMHASTGDLYDGASYGVRIYHVTAWINNAYDNDFGSFTDNNNSLSEIPLIKLVEADGENNFDSSDGLASDSDLWQEGASLNSVFPNYTRNDGKLLNFNVTIDSVSATEATITVTYAQAEAKA